MMPSDLADHPAGTRFLAYPPAHMQALINRMANQSMPFLHGHDHIAIVGVLRRGAPLADRLADALRQSFGMGSITRLNLKIKRYDDDLTLLHPHTELTETEAQREIRLDGYTVLLVDDVLYTGHSLFRAIEWLKKKSPRAIHCAVLVHRHVEEMPLRADIIGAHLQVASGDVVECHVPPYEEQFKIELLRLDRTI